MPESLSSRMFRYGFNLFPAYRGTGGRVTYIADDWREIKVRLPLNWRTRNYVGTIFGGSMYAAVDPFYMLMLMKKLGPEFTVWDKAAKIRFRKPGRGTLFARFVLDESEIEAIRKDSKGVRSIDRIYTLELTDEDGTVHAEIEKTIYVARKADQ